MLGNGSNQASKLFRPIIVSAFFTKIECHGKSVFALDESKNLWMWGQGSMTPTKYEWFRAQGLGIEEIRSGFACCAVMTKNTYTLQKELFVAGKKADLIKMSNNEQNFEEPSPGIFKLKNVSSESIIKFAMTKNSLVIIQSGKNIYDGHIHTTEPYQGMMLAYKKDNINQWEFMTPEEAREKEG
jgi:alpha-tubulin suppressor-like RCC1 family protein